MKKKLAKRDLSLSRRSKRASRKKYNAALEQVPNVPPIRGDEL
jgi:hypothetical protein